MKSSKYFIMLAIMIIGLTSTCFGYFWSNNGRITTIQFTRQTCCGNNIVACVYIEGDTKPYGFIINDTDYLGKTRYATLLTAYSNGSKVSLFSDNDNATLPIWGSTHAYVISHVAISQ